jgi:soluble P-type ATPase
MRNAYIAILTIQQPGERPEDLFKEADYVVKNVTEVVTIVKELSSAGHFDRERL